MPGNDKDLKIGITVEGADKAARDAEKVTEAVAQAQAAGNNPFKMSEEDLGPMKAGVETLRDFGDASDDLAESFEELTDDELTGEYLERVGSEAGRAGEKMAQTGAKASGLGRVMASLAGGPLSLVIAAAGFLYSRLKKADDALKAYTDSIDKATQSAIDNAAAESRAASEKVRSREATEELNRATSNYEASLASSIGALENYTRAAREKIKATNAERQAEDELIAARQELEREIATDDPAEAAKVAERQRQENARREIERLREDQRNAQEQLARASAAGIELDERRGVERSRNEGAIESAQARVDEAERNRIQAKRAAAEARARADTPRPGRRNKFREQADREDADRLADALRDRERELEAANNALKEATENSKASEREFQESQAGIDKQIAELFKRLRELENTIPAKESAERLREEAGGIRIGRASGQQAEREAAQTQQEQERADREEAKRLEQQIDNSAEEISRTFRERAGQANRNGLTKLAESLDFIARELQDGTDGAELERLSREFEQAVRGSRADTVQALRRMLAEQQRLASEVADLKGQIRNNRDGK